MVRLKHRYLLLNILYPDPRASKGDNDHKVSAVGDEPTPLSLQFHAPSADALTPALLARLIRDGVANLFGEYGSGVVGSSLQVKYLSSATSTAIIRVTRAHYRLVWAALTFITQLPRPINQPCVIQVVRVSGTIRKSEEEAIRRAKESILRAHAAGKHDVSDLLKVAGAGSNGREDPARGIEDSDDDDDDQG